MNETQAIELLVKLGEPATIAALAVGLARDNDAYPLTGCDYRMMVTHKTSGFAVTIIGPR